ncbi:MAG: N-acetylmuramoyl-L-alanine amidase [bacterium]|nr:N-acetylmuramoyl-L-alanine amidase [bacterium]
MKLCALVIGHKKASPGAHNSEHDVHEFNFNEKLSCLIEQKVGGDVFLQRVYRRTYRTLPDDLNLLDPDFIVSLHCNAYNKRTSGTEVLYHHTSEAGQSVARILQGHLVDHLGLRDRGIKPKTTEDRGGYLLRYTDAPCVISEPFFIDKNGDLERAQEDFQGLAGAYAGAIEDIAELVVD